MKKWEKELYFGRKDTQNRQNLIDEYLKLNPNIDWFTLNDLSTSAIKAGINKLKNKK